ncbi:MAG TPA: hypothetical protein DEV93_07675 [Chloroflexi bacterium]|nr:hypothetical protein [Chloroflexota bacterium]HAF18740.1 hypothetical protein [Chloroflexota bacterium]HCG00411.1 hypothetical protein [Chloroflexota bacterium]
MERDPLEVKLVQHRWIDRLRNHSTRRPAGILDRLETLIPAAEGKLWAYTRAGNRKRYVDLEDIKKLQELRRVGESSSP